MYLILLFIDKNTILLFAEISIRAVAAFTGLAKLIFEIKNRHQKNKKNTRLWNFLWWGVFLQL